MDSITFLAILGFIAIALCTSSPVATLWYHWNWCEPAVFWNWGNCSLRQTVKYPESFTRASSTPFCVFGLHCGSTNETCPNYLETCFYNKLYCKNWKWCDNCRNKPLVKLIFFFCSALSKTFKMRYCSEKRYQAYIADQGPLNPLNSRSRFSSLSLSFFYPGKVLLSTHALFQLNPVPH